VVELRASQWKYSHVSLDSQAGKLSIRPIAELRKNMGDSWESRREKTADQETCEADPGAKELVIE
jgi:hypothetical protein